MIETDEQRRWWFATHPEYSWSRRGIRTKREDGDSDQREYSPEDVDAYVAEGLKYYPTGPIAAMLQALKLGLGTNEGPTPLDGLLRAADADRLSSGTNDPTVNKNDANLTHEQDDDNEYLSGYKVARKLGYEETLNLVAAVVFGRALGVNIGKAIRTIEKLKAEHEQKLADYIKNPDDYDNKNLLKNAPNQEIREKIIQGRINKLKKEIDVMGKEIKKLKRSR
jgi:hypothetical protein